MDVIGSVDEALDKNLRRFGHKSAKSSDIPATVSTVTNNSTKQAGKKRCRKADIQFWARSLPNSPRINEPLPIV